MTKASGEKFDPARVIVDLAQADLSTEEFKRELLRAFDRAVGVDTAIAVREEPTNYAFVPYNADDNQLQLMHRSARYAKTRYAQDLLPVFALSAKVGVCRDVDFYTTDWTRRKSIYHQEVLAPAGVRSMILVCARWRGQPMLRLNLNRHGGQPFRRTEVEKVQSLLPTLEAAIAARYAREPGPSISGLTQREQEIAEYVAEGLTTAQIGIALGTSPYTVRNQLTRIYEKLGIESRAELAAYVARTKATH